jgi:hypothetical protein
MAKRRSSSGDELNLDSLMDAVTNVVGVLMIVFVMVSLQVARTVSKILTDLPPVTPEQLAKIKEEAKALPPPEKPPEKIEEEKKIAESELKKISEQLKTIDLSDVQQKLKFMDLDEIRKQIELRRLDRDKGKSEMDKLLTEIDRLKALLDQTPVYEAPPPTYVRLPNPRPYPEKPNETRVLVAKQGVILYRESDYLDPVKTGLESVKSQLEYQDVKIDPFAKMLESILGSKAEVAKAWPEISPLAGTFQMDLVANAYKNLAAAGIVPDKTLLDRLGNISLIVRQPLPDVATAVAAATKGDTSKWTTMDPSKDPAKPIIKVARAGNKYMFYWGAKPEEVKPTPRDITDYFKALGSQDSFKNAGKARVIYDAFRVAEVLKKAASSQIFSKSYVMTPTVKPGSTWVQIAMTPRAGGGESAEQLKQPNSGFISAMRSIKSDPNGVALFQVMPDAFNTYLDARRIADEVGVPATWEFLKGLDLIANVTGYEVQRFADGLPSKNAPKPATGITIAPPKRTLD